MTKVIAFINYKGGVGKTTTGYHIGCALAKFHKKRVLLVDVDPQTNMTFLCAIFSRWETFRQKSGTLASLFDAFLKGNRLSLKTILWKTPIELAGRPIIPNLDLVPSDVELLTIDIDLASKVSASADLHELGRQHLELRTVLRSALDEVREEYDYILIDCPPNLYLVTQNALAASDAYVVTALPDHLSTIGLTILQRRIGRMNSDLSIMSGLAGLKVSGPTLGGIIFVRVRLGGQKIVNMHSQKMIDVSNLFPKKTFVHYTTELIGYGQASEQALPVFEMSGSNARRASQQYVDITNEFLKRF